MKKKNLTSLRLNKKSISSLEGNKMQGGSTSFTSPDLSSGCPQATDDCTIGGDSAFCIPNSNLCPTVVWCPL